MVIKYKGCPRCQGDLYLTEDVFGKFASCIQCGFIKEVEALPKLKDQMPYSDSDSKLNAA